ncbi:MAG: hypothetical protein FWE05_02425 [Defluviitaleaceae bacterium]|nr:hypothetical protein [Defluviitaleaceae bacterium]
MAERKRRTDISRAPRKSKPRGEIIPFRQNIPKKLSRRNENLVIYYDQLRTVITLEMILTFVLIAVAAIFVTAIHAYNANVSTEISSRNQYLRNLQSQVFSLEEQLSDRYTSYEIERIATQQLGMAFPDQSQIHLIEVHRQGTVGMSVAEYILPPENHFWQDVTSFVRSTVNNIFGGGS